MPLHLRVLLSLTLLSLLGAFLPLRPLSKLSVLLAVALVLTWWLYRRYTLSLRAAISRALEIAAGNLARRPVAGNGSEVGVLARALEVVASETRVRLARLGEERSEMDALINGMNEGVLVLAAGGDVLRANPAALAIFGLSGDPRGLPTEVVDRRPEFLALARRALEGETVPPTELRRGDRQLVVTGQPLAAGGAVIFCLDVSEMRRLEDVRRDFVANASHELKTPLTVLRGYLETLEDENLPAALRKQFLETLRANADRLQRVVEDLLDLSRIESGGWRVEPVALSLATVARESWTEFAERADAGEVEFHCDVNPEILRVAADPAALRQVFCNLYDNALRYTPPGGAVTVTAARVGEAVRVEVGDNGSGISAAHLSRIFERFYRADSGRARSGGGTGLGLAIVRHFVERHGGEIDAASELGSGTTIGFTLPAAEEDTDAAPVEARITEGVESLRRWVG